MDQDLVRTLGFSPRLLKQAIDQLEQWVSAGKLPGCAFALFKRDQPAFVYQTGYSNIEQAVAFSASTLVRAASLSKILISVVCLQCVEQGLCQLDDPVSQYIPQVNQMRVLKPGSELAPEFEDLQTPITLHHLLSHQSGLGYSYNVPKSLQAAYDDRDVFQLNQDMDWFASRLCQLPLLFQPGQGFCYGLSTDLLGCALEVVTQRSLDELLTEQVLEPLGMSHSGFSLPGHDKSNLAPLYLLNKKNELALQPSQIDIKFTDQLRLYAGGGGVLSTLNDYLQFIQVLLGQGQAKQQQLISPESLALITQNHRDPDFGPWDLGAGVQYDTSDYGFGYNVKVLLPSAHKDFPIHAGEYGWAGAFNSYLWVEPVLELGVLLFSQVAPFARVPIDAAFKRLVYQAYLN